MSVAFKVEPPKPSQINALERLAAGEHVLRVCDFAAEVIGQRNAPERRAAGEHVLRIRDTLVEVPIGQGYRFHSGHSGEQRLHIALCGHAFLNGDVLNEVGICLPSPRGSVVLAQTPAYAIRRLYRQRIVVVVCEYPGALAVGARIHNSPESLQGRRRNEARRQDERQKKSEDPLAPRIPDQACAAMRCRFGCDVVATAEIELAMRVTGGGLIPMIASSSSSTSVAPL